MTAPAPFEALAASEAVEQAIRGLVESICLHKYGLDGPAFHWLDDTTQAEAELQAGTWGETRMCWLESASFNTAKVAHGVLRYDELARLNISYEVDAHSSPQVIYRQIRADALVLYRVFNVRFDPLPAPLQRLIATPGHVIEQANALGDDHIATLVHQIPLQMQYLAD